MRSFGIIVFSLGTPDIGQEIGQQNWSAKLVREAKPGMTHVFKFLEQFVLIQPLLPLELCK
jgi:hypothetical protein